MIRLFKDEYKRLDDFIEECMNDDLTWHAQEALNCYAGYDDTKLYAVIKVKGYYCITKIIDDMINWANVSEEVQPFDQERIYPLQKFEKTLDWVY